VLRHDPRQYITRNSHKHNQFFGVGLHTHTHLGVCKRLGTLWKPAIRNKEVLSMKRKKKSNPPFSFFSLTSEHRYYYGRAVWRRDGRRKLLIESILCRKTLCVCLPVYKTLADALATPFWTIDDGWQHLTRVLLLFRTVTHHHNYCGCYSKERRRKKIHPQVPQEKREK
jgi:hypothetical protein